LKTIYTVYAEKQGDTKRIDGIFDGTFFLNFQNVIVNQ